MRLHLRSGPSATPIVLLSIIWMVNVMAFLPQCRPIIIVPQSSSTAPTTFQPKPASPVRNNAPPLNAVRPTINNHGNGTRLHSLSSPTHAHRGGDDHTPPDELPKTPEVPPRGLSDDSELLTVPPKSRGEDRESARHWFYWLITWPKRELLPGVRWPMFAIVAWTILVVNWYRDGLFAPLDPTPHSMLAGPIGFLLSFRASEGYSRCVEGHRLWDGVLNQCRDIVRAVIACSDMLGPQRTRRLVDLTCAYAIALEEHAVQKDRSLVLRTLLLTSDAVGLAHGPNRPLFLAERLAEELIDAARESKDLSGSPHYPRLLSKIDELGHYVAQCQRLMKSPVPQIYAGHSLRFLTLWTFSLPFVLVSKVPLSILPAAMAFITWALFGLRELGVRIQYPFEVGVVDLKRLWQEVVWDTRTCFQGAQTAKAVAMEEKAQL